MKVCVSIVLFTVLLQCQPTLAAKHPHVVFIVADDLGWNDIGFHNPDIISPNIDRLARAGTIFNHSYVQPVCSPSRSAMMSGFYPFRLGLQHLVIGGAQKVCLPLNKTLLPEVFKKNGYATHAVGKWHLGYCKAECTPTYRGFDSFLGYFNSEEDYYSKVYVGGYDFHYNDTVHWQAAGKYSSFLYADRALDLINAHDKNNPLFLYLPLQSVHKPLEVPDRYYNLYPNVSNNDRRIFSGMVTALDDVVGAVVSALKKNEMYHDTIIFFTADNGGWIPYAGNNYPLRGGKITIWEGGTRVPGFVHSAKYVESGAVYDGIMHAVDWMPTILEAANLTHEDPDRDGISQWQAITSRSDSPRKEFVYNLDNFHPPVQGKAAIRVGDFKLIDGYPGPYSDWYPPATRWTGYFPKSDYSDSQYLYETSSKNWTNFHGLFNLKDDPFERNNLFESQPEMAAKLKQRLDFYRQKMVPANYPPGDPDSNPIHFKGAWSTGWC